MGRKIFISYKYSDSQVHQLDKENYWEQTTVRDYVDLLQDYLDETDNINKGEDDGEDMSSLADSTIASKLGDKIFDSSVTIVFISKGMKEIGVQEKDQWIPWEISYSLKEQTRKTNENSKEVIKSKTNAVLAVVLPDENGYYDYYLTQKDCCRVLKTDVLFDILQKNMFNEKKPNTYFCETCYGTHYKGNSSYIYSVTWDEFKKNPNEYIDLAVNIKENIADYNITKELS